MADHSISPDRASLHGDFDAARPPILTIDPGDRVTMSTLEAGWRLEPSANDTDQAPRIEPRDPVRDAGHALCGPIAIRGAEPGMTLAVHIDEIVPGTWGTTPVGGWDSPFNRRLGLVDVAPMTLRWTVDAAAGVCRDQHGHEVPTHPFLGVMGMPPASVRPVPTGPPRAQGGNLDCQELTAGATLFLPIAVAGGLFSAGDGHAAQSDGEICGTAIEAPMERVVLRLDLRDDMPLTTPRARTPTDWLTFGFNEDLDEAVWAAMDDMLNLMGELLGIGRQEAFGLASMVVRLRVTQMVNGVKGAHAMISHETVERLSAGSRRQ